jgi:hypothetical protein
MAHRSLQFRNAAIALLALILPQVATQAQGGLKSIDPPQGGKIVYGQVVGQSTEAGAMGAVLRSLHQSLGEKPQVGKLFDVRGTDSVATFFTVTRHDQGTGKGSLQISGLLIATKVSSDYVEAALVSDDAARFPKTLGPMMKTLMSSWHPFEGVAAPGSVTSVSSSPTAALHQITLPDRSASIGLPDGWQLVPNQSAMGTIVAQGPNGENAAFGLTFLAYDTNNPRVQQNMRIVQNGGMRNSVYASGFYYPYGGNMEQAFLATLQNARRKAGLQPAEYNFTSATPMPQSGRLHCIHMQGTGDFKDGKGTRELNTIYCVAPPTPAAGIWAGIVYSTAAPVQVAGGERATLGAIMQSFNTNEAVVQQQGRQIAAPAIAQIHAIGKMVDQRVAATHQAEDIHNSSVYQHWDSMDRRSQEFENYQLGYAVVSDTQNTAHGTLWADDAAALVQSNPDRFEYVSAPNYWKGIDY